MFSLRIDWLNNDCGPIENYCVGRPSLRNDQGRETNYRIAALVPYADHYLSHLGQETALGGRQLPAEGLNAPLDRV